MFGANKPGHHPLAAGGAGAIASVAHDIIMTPMDMCKQRLQLGYYKGTLDCLRTVAKEEGFRALFVSLPTTMIMNIPYGIVMVASNESLKKILNPSNEQNIYAFLAAGAGAGAVVSRTNEFYSLPMSNLDFSY
jgi:solute carrier family 25 iron transporter 28/37